MTKFILIRHGQTVENGSNTIQGWNGSHLTDLGHQQAEKAAHELPATPDLIFTSDLYRCQQTTTHIQEVYPDVHTLTDWRVRERSYGNLEGRQSSSIDWDEFWAKHDNESFHGAEPISFMNERIKAFIRSVQQFDVETVLVVTHSGVLNRFGYLFTDGFERHRYPNAAIVTYELAADDPRLMPGDATPWRPYGTA